MRKNHTMIAAAAFVAVSAIVVLYALVDPADAQWMPKCVFHEVTGLDCPGCGAQRALHALLEGRISDAFMLNPYVFIAVPVAAALGIVELGRDRWPSLYMRIYRPVLFYIILAVTILWWILRNIFGI